MASMQTLERRIAALESRLADVEGGYGETIYRLHRAVVGLGVGQARILEHLKIAPVTDSDIDSVMDGE